MSHRHRTADQIARAVERERKSIERAQAAHDRQERQNHITRCEFDATSKTEQVQAVVAEQQTLLSRATGRDSYVNLDSLAPPKVPIFNPGALATPTEPPVEEAFLPSSLSRWQRLLPGAKKRQARRVATGRNNYLAQRKVFEAQESKRKAALAELKTRFDRKAANIRKRVDAHNRTVEAIKLGIARADSEAIATYFILVLKACNTYPEGFPFNPRIVYVAESKQLVVEYDLPPFDVVPCVQSYRYVKARNEVVEIARPLAERRTLYSQIIAQVALRTLRDLFMADREDRVETIVFNGYVNAIDKGTGREIRPCLITVRTTKETMSDIDLAQVDPTLCLKALNASVSRGPSELVPVRPVVEFNMVDPRFVKEGDVLSALDKRPNLMELTPRDFETLISNLFEKMGLEMRLTRPSRDGGVDCVAYDSRPILGGKVVIQAKRYKNTVGVSAVRDLFGTMHNEGASKGILVTTSGYGKASFEFARNKPLELLSGTNLLYLLKEFAGMEAKIEVPEDWTDPPADRGDPA
jgi:restriction system protein